VVKYARSEKWTLDWASRLEKSAMWKAIAHVQPLATYVAGEIIKHFFILRNTQEF
jgi:hypothetical protein